MKYIYIHKALKSIIIVWELMPRVFVKMFELFGWGRQISDPGYGLRMPSMLGNFP